MLIAGICNAQLIITTQSNAQALAQRLVGDGVTISNVTLSADPVSTGFFRNAGGTNIGLDSGIVLTNGRAKTLSQFDIGVDGDNFTPAYDPSGTDAFASNEVNYNAHDADLEQLINAPTDETHDATILEFDFVPVGDTIKFRYVFSSEEYPVFACPGISNYNDAFAFFIQGPGYPVRTNIALVPGSTDPVTINNINDQACGVYPQFYVNNYLNTRFTHNGHTTVFTAIAQVQPCQTYHLKLVIADVADGIYDSGVFLDAKSLTSNVVHLTNNTRTDGNSSYIVEGCISGSITVKRPQLANYPLSVRLMYGGTAINGVDVQLLPDIITIPANDTVATVNIIPIVDNIPEGIELLKIYAAPGCGSTVPIDSTVIELRDYDTLGIVPQDSIYICKNGSIQLQASSNPTSTYQWNATAGLNNYTIDNPVATPVANGAMYVCTASLGTCHGKDSVLVKWKDLEFNSSVNVNCQNAATGQIIVSGGPEWSSAPVQYHINSQPSQPGGIFNGLIVGNYMVHITDASGCKDSLPVSLAQAYPDLVVNNIATLAATCTSASDGTITVTAAGGKPPYRYSNNGSTFQVNNVFHVGAATFTISVMDANNCRVDIAGVVVPFINGITLSVSPDATICESRNTTIQVTTNAASVNWTTDIASQLSTLNDPHSLNPVANPVVTTSYYILATLGVCTLRDTVTVFVNPAPVPDAGADVGVCYGGQVRLEAAPGLASYHWTPSTYLSNPGISNPLVSQALTTTYYLEVMDFNGCRSLATDQVTVNVRPPAQLNAGHDTVVAINQPLALNAIDVHHTGFTQYTWSPATGLSNPFIHNPVAVLSLATNYLVVTATTPEGCTGIDTIKVQTYQGPEIYVPNSFTPNGDGVHDYLKAFTVGIKTFHYFYIYNRYGQLIFATTDANRGWDGRVKGYLQNMSSFVWIAEGIDFKGKLVQRKGVTTIVQ